MPTTMQELIAQREQEEQEEQDERDNMRALIEERELQEQLASRRPYVDPRQEVLLGIGRGISGAAEETFDLLASIDEWSLRTFGGVDLNPFDGDGIHFVSPSEARQFLDAGGQSPIRVPESGWQMIHDTIPETETLVGGVAETGSQFVAGFLGAGKVRWLANLRGAAPRTGAFVQGAIADLTVFDEHDERLSNLIQSVPALQNPVTEYLAADEDDGAIEGRIKNVLEGGGLGVIADQIVAGIKAIRNARRIQREAAEDAAQREADNAIAEKLEAAEGRPRTDAPDADDVPTQREADEVIEESTDESVIKLDSEDSAADIIEKIQVRLADEGIPEPLLRAVEEGDIRHIQDALGDEKLLDWTRIDDPDQMLKVMDALSEALTGMAQRNPAFHKTTLREIEEKALSRLGDELGVDLANLYRDVNKDGTLAGRFMAAQMAIVDTITSLRRLGELANAGRADGIQLMAFREQLDRLKFLQAYATNSATGIGQALRAMRVYKRSIVDGLSELDELKGRLGQGEDTLELAALLEDVLRTGTAGDVVKAVRMTGWMKADAVLREVGYGNMLSAPSTHEANVLGNAFRLIEGLFNKPLSYVGGLARRGVNTVRGRQTDEFTSLDEVKGYFAGTLTGWDKATRGLWRMLGKVVDTANPMSKATKADLQLWARESEELGRVWKTVITGDPVTDVLTKIGDQPLRDRAIDAEFILGGTKFWESAPKYLKAFLSAPINTVGRIYRIPGHLIATADELFKTIAFEQQIMSEAYANVGTRVRATIRDGGNVADEATTLLNDVRAVKRATEFAREQTFQKSLPGPLATFEKAVRSTPFGWVVLPFIRTPVNIFTGAFRLMGATPLVKTIFGRPGKARDAAIGQLMLGTAVSGSALMLALNGRLRGSGSGNNSERLEGIQPYSIRIGDTWHQFNRLDPLGMVLGLVADSVEGWNDMDTSPEADHWTYQMVGVASVATAQNMTSKTFLRGVNDFFEVILEDNDDRAADKFTRWATTVGANLLPLGGSNFERRAASGMDDFSRYAFTAQEQLKLRAVEGGLLDHLVGNRQELGVRRDALGRPIEETLGLTTIIKESTASTSIVDNVLADLDFNIPMPARSFANGEVRLTSQQYSRLVELRGQELRFGGMNLEQQLEAIILSPGFNQLGTFDQQAVIRSVASDYTRAAKEQLFIEFPELPERINEIDVFKRAEPTAAQEANTREFVEALLDDQP